MKIGILGGGVMGEIIAQALLQRELFAPTEIMIAELDLSKHQSLEALGVKLTVNSLDLIPFADVILICVKPQSAKDAIHPLQAKMPPDTLAISIMAGIDLPWLMEHLKHPLIIRCMPNLPSRIGEGITVWQATPGVPDFLKMIARTIFQALGKEIEVDQENLLNGATAVSGTGPAYIFYIAENLLEAALSLGFNEQQALKLVRETFRGAMDLWAETQESPIDLRRKVTSKGGTTHAAISYFQQKDIAGIFRAGVRQAYLRAVELAEQTKNNISG